MKKLITIIGAVLLLAAVTQPINAGVTDRLGLDAGAIYNTDSEDVGVGVNLNFKVGAGFGLSLGADALDVENFDIDNTSLSLSYTAPFSLLRFTPYALGGAGWDFNAKDHNFHAGAGLNFKITTKIGLFGEYRRIFEREAADQNQVRSGLRFNF